MKPHHCLVCGGEIEKMNKGGQWLHPILCRDIYNDNWLFDGGEGRIDEGTLKKIEGIYKIHIEKNVPDLL